MGMCPRCDTPVISTMAWRSYEFYCLECGAHLGFLSPRAAESTPELIARYDALKAEWDEHAGGKLITQGGWLQECSVCAPRGETHEAHATAEEIAAHEEALAWLRERAAR